VKILVIGLCVICQLLLLTGQLFFKRAMAPAVGVHSGRHTAKLLALGILTNTFYFFIWLGLLERNPLTKIFPFEGLNPAMMAILAWIVLKERLSGTAIVGLLLVCAGISVVWRS
jgi:drug/metabolite transporter (DMT)-like permease